VFDEMSSPAYMQEFTNKVCGLDMTKMKKWKKVEDQECLKKWQSAFYARLDRAYPYMDTKEVSERCQAYPIECSNLNTMEIWARQSQNERLEAFRAYEHDRAIATQKQAEADEKQRKREAWGRALRRSLQRIDDEREKARGTDCISTQESDGRVKTHCKPGVQ
jgi:hypothetical protein